MCRQINKVGYGESLQQEGTVELQAVLAAPTLYFAEATAPDVPGQFLRCTLCIW